MDSDWVILYSEELKEKVAYNKFTGEAVVQDGRVRYRRRELKLLSGDGITREVHMVKKVFSGEIVQ